MLAMQIILFLAILGFNCAYYIGGVKGAKRGRAGYAYLALKVAVLALDMTMLLLFCMLMQFFVRHKARIYLLSINQ